MTTDPIEQVAKDQLLTRVKAAQHCLTEAKLLLDKEQLVACIERMKEVVILVEFDPLYERLISAIENKIGRAHV